MVIFLEVIKMEIINAEALINKGKEIGRKEALEEATEYLLTLDNWFKETNKRLSFLNWLRQEDEEENIN